MRFLVNNIYHPLFIDNYHISHLLSLLPLRFPLIDYRIPRIRLLNYHIFHLLLLLHLSCRDSRILILSLANFESYNYHILGLILDSHYYPQQVHTFAPKCFRFYNYSIPIHRTTHTSFGLSYESHPLIGFITYHMIHLFGPPPDQIQKYFLVVLYSVPDLELLDRYLTWTSSSILKNHHALGFRLNQCISSSHSFQNAKINFICFKSVIKYHHSLHSKERTKYFLLWIEILNPNTIFIITVISGTSLQFHWWGNIGTIKCEESCQSSPWT